MTYENEPDRFRDAVAFARAVTQDDFEGADMIMSSHEHFAAVMVPLAWIAKSLADHVSETTRAPVDEVWAAVLESIENVDKKRRESGNEDSDI